jgi:ribosomal protein S27E
MIIPPFRSISILEAEILHPAMFVAVKITQFDHTQKTYGYPGSTLSCCICSLHLCIWMGCTYHLQAVGFPMQG